MVSFLEGDNDIINVEEDNHAILDLVIGFVRYWLVVKVF